MRIQIITAIALSLLSANAYAGAWTQSQGTGLAILGGTYYNADHLYNNNGDRRNQPTYSKYELSPYLEYGVTDAITVGTNLSLQRAHQDGAAGSSDQTHWGVGDSEFFLRGRLYQHNGFVVAAEPMIKLPSPESSGSQPKLGGSHPDAGMGLSAGYGFKAYGQNHFADLDTQYRHRFGAPKDQVKIAGTVGVGLSDRWILMPQAFITQRTSSPAVATFTQSSGDDYNEFKLQLSAVYKASDDISIQVGGFSDVDGKNVGEGRGVLVALWKKF
jgi:hypothetical protein